MNKNNILFIFLILLSLPSLGQEAENIDVLDADSTWLKELIKFPLGFAPELKYEGFEDLRFATKWREKDHADFWTYAFVWCIDLDKELTEQELESSLEIYYDGLMKAVNKDKDFSVPKTTVHFKEDTGSKDIMKHIGKVEVYDSFHTKEVITLNVLVEHHYCEETKTYIPFFRLSPKSFDHEIWKKLKKVVLRDNSCIR